MFGFTKGLKNTISIQENAIRIYKEKLHNKELYIVNLVADNATLKQRINILESQIINIQIPTVINQQKSAIHPNLLAYYNRGKNKTK